MSQAPSDTNKAATKWIRENVPVKLFRRVANLWNYTTKYNILSQIRRWYKIHMMCFYPTDLIFNLKKFYFKQMLKT